LKFLVNSSYKNNFNYFNITNYFFFSYQKRFIKNKKFFKKTVNDKRLDLKLDSLRRFKNFSFNNQIFNIWVKKGFKLNLLKHYNIFLKNFYMLLLNDAEQYRNSQNYNYVFELLDTKYYYYRLENLLKDPFKELEYIFDLKIKKLNKKLQKKYKKKYDYKIIHINKAKRLRYIIKLLYSNINLYKHNKYSDRIFFLFVSTIFNTKDLEIWERRISTYKIIYKHLNKNN